MILQNWWYTTLLEANEKSSHCPPLRGDRTTEFLVVGGGMAGLHAALALVRREKKVILLERNIAGGSSTGKSAGFLTPDSELELSQLLRRFGKDDAKKLWDVAVVGVGQIVESIKEYGFSCDFITQDSLFLGLGSQGRRTVLEEAQARAELGFPYTSYEGDGLKAVNTGKDYRAGIRYGDTYGINPLLYAQELKRKLLELGVEIYESTEVVKIDDHTAQTHLGTVTADQIIVAMDKMPESISPIAREAYHAQTFLSVSEPLDENDVAALFPSGDVMCWDSQLVYTYYRLTGDRRLLLGGGSALTTFTPSDVTHPTVIETVLHEWKQQFPALAHVQFVQYWPGRIDTTKDLLPIVDFDPKHQHIQYLLGCVGLPWAAAMGRYAVERLFDTKKTAEFNRFFGQDRKFFISPELAKIFGKMATFSMNNGYAKYIQKGY